MENFLECQSCGQHVDFEHIEKHVIETHFWN
jgi:hypothetical protein